MELTPPPHAPSPAAPAGLSSQRPTRPRGATRNWAGGATCVACQEQAQVLVYDKLLCMFLYVQDLVQTLVHTGPRQWRHPAPKPPAMGGSHQPGRASGATRIDRRRPPVISPAVAASPEPLAQCPLSGPPAGPVLIDRRAQRVDRRGRAPQATRAQFGFVHPSITSTAEPHEPTGTTIGEATPSAATRRRGVASLTRC